MYVRQLFCLFLLLLSSCGKSSSKTWQIAIDPTWYPLDLGGREKQLEGFATDFLQEMTIYEKMEIVKVRENWDSLLGNLQKEKYDAVLSSLSPYTFYEKLYDFSEPFVHTGPVLVLSAQSSAISLKDFNGKEVGILEGSSLELILEKYSGIIIRTYASIPDMLNDLLLGAVDGALVPTLDAVAYIEDLYQSELKIVGKPLDAAGLRLITLHKNGPELIKAFNATLEKLKKNGKYNQLAKKWNIPAHEGI